MLVKKNSGELIPYNPNALKRSLTKSGAKKEEVEDVFEKISKDLYEGITTRELYRTAFQYLKDYRSSYAARYSLKRALRDLGPEGYYFEMWFARVMQAAGYETIHSETVQGNAVTHEIDVVAAKENQLIFCECKFRNDEEAKISVTTPMYFLSRMKDVEQHTYHFFGRDMKPSKGYLVTNAYLTTDSIEFANYYGIGLISWDYPENKSIKYLVDNAGLYPVTCLTTLTDEQEKILLSKDCILVKDLVQNQKILDSLNLSKEIMDAVLEEANDLLAIENFSCEIE
ncbi:Restriction endonuclease [Algoriella xinjiangensis]|uniref:Restriction endonuclease n=1 Tax=Algoriella xinjiangensis TaxID=684065 RepID=A0A1I4X1W5_9FLAO|nr:ATP cone domain-containing protein [Algoriella xinjiangensis]SFN20001.1 Restriction endonuclease [Algoriella xinjiangensis]VDH14702.1 ATP cone domain [Algoriella xinjiangensis]